MLLVIDIGNTNTSLGVFEGETLAAHWRDRKSTRLNSSHSQISYAVFCLKKKKKNTTYFILNIHRARIRSLPSILCMTTMITRSGDVNDNRLPAILHAFRYLYIIASTHIE